MQTNELLIVLVSSVGLFFSAFAGYTLYCDKKERNKGSKDSVSHPKKLRSVGNAR